MLSHGYDELTIWLYMRDRYQETIVSNHGNVILSDLQTGGSSVAWTNSDYTGHVSKMLDVVSKDKHSFKPCTHMTYEATATGTPGIYHPITALSSNPASPRFLYTGNIGHYGTGQLTPPSWGSSPTWIDVTQNTSDDLANCVFNAYNQFVNGVRALDASQSIAELGETPQLFRIWQRRRGLTANLTNGFLNYSFGWRPVLSDLRAIRRELRQFPSTVRKRLRGIGNDWVTRHYKFSLDSTVKDYSVTYWDTTYGPYPWNHSYAARRTKSGTKKRTVVVTVRAKVKPKLTGRGQDILNQLGTLGLIPSLATLWAVTRLSFVVDWFYNIGGAIENLQGCLTHDVSNIQVCVSDSRSIEIEMVQATGSGNTSVAFEEKLRYFNRYIPTVTSRFLPQLRIPNSPMKYVLLSFISLSRYLNTPGGKRLERALDRVTNPNLGRK